MKIYIRLIITLLILVSSQPGFSQVTIFACEPEWAALAKELGGQYLTIISATTLQQDPHHIQARPSLIAKIRRADMIACTGAELEIGWLPLLLRKSSNPAIKSGELGYFMATDQVSLLDKPLSVDRSQGDIHAAGNPHIQFDPYRISQVANAMTARLIQIDPDNKSHYEEKGKQFTQRWQEAIQQWEKLTLSLHGKTFVAYHQGWSYLSQWLGLKQIAVLEPKPGVPPSSAHLAEILTQVSTHPPDFIIYASYQSDKAAQWLSSKIGKKAISIPFTVSDDETLTQWYEHVIHLLLESS